MTATTTTHLDPTTAQDASTARRLKVLVVDDSQTIRAAAQSVLGSSFEVAMAEDGFAALAKLSTFRPDIIFIDIVMPRLDGYETVSLLRSNAAFNAVPVIMMSSRGGAFDVAKGRLIGCNDYIVKPFEKDALLEVMARHVPDATLAATDTVEPVATAVLD